MCVSRWQEGGGRLGGRGGGGGSIKARLSTGALHRYTPTKNLVYYALPCMAFTSLDHFAYGTYSCSDYKEDSLTCFKGDFLIFFMKLQHELK